ncbi:MAG: hypothetical protein NVSMB62_08810 [Acidobacteriaceae bacterium]
MCIRPPIRLVAKAFVAVSLMPVCAYPQTPAAPSAPKTTTAPVAGQRPPLPAIGVPVAGMPFVHDPSTVVRFHGRYFVYSTGRGLPFYSSQDGLTWTREESIFTEIPKAVHATVPKNNGLDVWAPDILRVGDQFFLYYSVSSWGSFQSTIALATNTTLDPKDPKYRWVDRGIVVSSNGNEDLNAIDPGVILAPGGTLWICYGSYHGSIRVTQLDPATGLAINPGKLGQAIATARESEAADIIFHEGYFYLFVNHGSCCKGKDSQYNIRVGRSTAITGPYLDRHGVDLNAGGGSLFLAAHDHRIGPGHFGRLLDYDAPSNGIERFSIHYEADLTRNGRSTLDIRPLLWSSDGWPVAGDHLPDGTYQLISRETENTLGIYPPASKKPGDTPTRQSSSAEEIPTLRLNRYLARPYENWTIAEAGAGLYKIVNSGTGDALAVSAHSKNPEGTGVAVTIGPYTGAPEQLWSVEQFADSAYSVRNPSSGLCLSEDVATRGVLAGSCGPSDLHRWTIASP